MPELQFAESEPLTVGIEEEFLLLDPQGGIGVPAPSADVLLDGGWNAVASPGGWLKPELMRRSIEIATAASRSFVQLEVDLGALRQEVVRRAAAAGWDVVALGLHPDLRVRDEDVTPTPAHEAIAALHRRVDTLADQVTHGIHVHVGMPSAAAAVAAMEALAAHVPLLVAATANSPFVRGRRSPWCSARSEVLRRMLWAGPPPRFADEREYAAVHALHQLENSGRQRFLWEVAPVPQLGTVELRAVDANCDPRVALGVAALARGLAAWTLDGGRPARPHESLERHNRWSAMEFGARARFLVEGRDGTVEAIDLLYDALELVRPYARDLDCEPWLDVFDELFDDPPADRTLTAFESGGVGAVLDQAVIRAERDAAA